MISKSKQSPEEIAEMHPDNRYQTPVSLAHAAMEKLYDLAISPSYLLDLGCGDLPVWGLAARAAGFMQPMAGIDIRPVDPPENYYDAGVYSGTSFKQLKPDASLPLIFGNPPFSEVREIVNFYHDTLTRGYLYLLLKLEFMSPKSTGYAKRDDIWRHTKPSCIFPIGKRPGWWYYTPEMNFSRKTNSTDYAMYLWDIYQSPEYIRVEPFGWKIDEALEEKIKGMVK